MSTNMPGHNHGGKSHLLGMLGIGALVLIVLLGTGKSVQQALPLALFLACPLMMVAMMFMMGGKGNHHGDDDTRQPDHNDAADPRDHDAAEPWQDSPNMTSPQPPQSTKLP